MAIDKKRALNDETYFNSLTPAEVAEFEASLTEADLDQVAGGRPCQLTTGSCLASKRMGCTSNF